MCCLAVLVVDRMAKLISFFVDIYVTIAHTRTPNERKVENCMQTVNFDVSTPRWSRDESKGDERMAKKNKKL